MHGAGFWYHDCKRTYRPVKEFYIHPLYHAIADHYVINLLCCKHHQLPRVTLVPILTPSHTRLDTMSCHPGMSTPTPTFPEDLHDSNKRIDFISELPLGVVMYNLVPRILGEHPTPFLLDIPNNYLGVCRTWCQRILMTSGRMRCTIRSTFLISKNQELLDAAGSYVKRLDIAPISDISINQLADTVKFTSLSELTITSKDR